MPEGLLIAGGAVTGAVLDDQEHPPDPGPEAPRGWTWDRKNKRHVPRQRGAVLWKDGDAQQQAGMDGAAHGPADQGRDPAPSWLRPGADPKPDPPLRLGIANVPAQVRHDMAGMAGLVGAPVLAMLQQADPYCGTILAQSYEGVVDAVLPLLCRSEKIVSYFSGDNSDWLLWGKLAMALAPFGRAVLEHHVVRTVRVVRDDDGEIRIERRRAEPDDGQHLTPPVTPEYSV